jgi:glycosyltransferase involved in cell wall biosynthesis
MVGNSYPHKNHAIVLKLLKKYRAQISEHFYLLTHRDRFSEALQKTISDANLSDRIHIVFDASDTTLAWMYEKCKALVFPSLSEGFGIPPLEALSYKKPVVAAKTSSLPEILGDEAYWFDPTNEATLFEALLNVDKQKIFNESVLKKYSWTVAAKSTRNLYQSVLY